MNTLFLWATLFPLLFSMLTQWTFPGFRENPENGMLCLRQNIFKMQHFHTAIPQPSLPSSLILWPLFAGMCEGGTGSFSWLGATGLAWKKSVSGHMLRLLFGDFVAQNTFQGLICSVDGAQGCGELRLLVPQLYFSASVWRLLRDFIPRRFLSEVDFFSSCLLGPGFIPNRSTKRNRFEKSAGT